MGCSLQETTQFINTTTKIKERLRHKEEYLNDVKANGKSYQSIKEYFQNYTSFLKYSEEASCESFYRVRKYKDEDKDVYKKVSDLKYPEPDIKHKDRMNNTSFRVLYTSLHEYTAMSEARLDESFVGRKFQLTRFSRKTPLKIYRLGLFSDLYFNSPRDSNLFKKAIEQLLGDSNHDNAVCGYSALEAAMSNILYDQEDGYHILSSILADAIFSSNPEIEAIIYPSMQNRYGTNIALNQKSADALNVSYTSVNELTETHPNGFYRYVTKLECTDFSNSENLSYGEPPFKAMYR